MSCTGTAVLVPLLLLLVVVVVLLMVVGRPTRVSPSLM